MLQVFGRFSLFAAGLAILTACDLPAGAPNVGHILKGSEAPDATFAVYPVTRETLPLLKSWPRKDAPIVAGWIERARGPASQIIEAGDTLDLAIWDNGDSSLLTQPGQKAVDLRGVRVSATGTVFLPYVDEIYVAKMTPDNARKAIQEKFVPLIPAVQVQLNHTAGRQSSVDLVSGVASPGNYVMPDRDFTVLSLIAQGGGIPSSMPNPQVRLMRDGRLYGISSEKLMASPALDTTLRGGDKVYVESDKRYFLSLGAAGKEAQIPFPSDTITALDAASLIGGVQDTRGNPKGVLVLRNYEAKDMRPDGTGPAKERVIFAIDLTSADGLFSAGEFLVQDRDLVLVTESPVTAANTVVQLMFSALGVGLRANSISNN